MTLYRLESRPYSEQMKPMVDYEALALDVVAETPLISDYHGYPELQREIAMDQVCEGLSVEDRTKVLGYLMLKPQRRGIAVIGAMHLREEF